MKRCALALAVLLALTLPLAAQTDDAAHRAKAQEMMALLHTEHTIQQISGNITQQIGGAADEAAGPNPTPEQKAKIGDFKKQVAQMIDAKLGWPAMKPELTDVYMKAFTDEQLDAIIAFYKTPAGAALLDKMPAVNAQFDQIGAFDGQQGLIGGSGIGHG